MATITHSTHSFPMGPARRGITLRRLASIGFILSAGAIVALVWFSLAPSRPAATRVEPVFTTEPIIVTPSGTMVEQPRPALRTSGQLSRS